MCRLYIDPKRGLHVQAALGWSTFSLGEQSVRIKYEGIDGTLGVGYECWPLSSVDADFAVRSVDGKLRRMTGDARRRAGRGVHKVFSIATAAATAMGVAACGARTGLMENEREAPRQDAPTDIQDAAIDAKSDVDKRDCVAEGITYIYVITHQERLYRFDPKNATFSEIGTIRCPNTASMPNSMAVERAGTAYVVFLDGQLFEVSTRDASCSTTPFAPRQFDWMKFGMGFATRFGGPDEVLYVADTTYRTTSRGLGIIDTSSFVLTLIGPFSIPLGNSIELTGTGDGRLFAFALPTIGSTSRLAEIDPVDAKVLSDTPIPIGTPDSPFAFAHWGNDFYLFLATWPGMPTTVTRYRPTDGSLTDVATLDTTVVGAGVSTCAPER